jgi:hypothetical protein
MSICTNITHAFKNSVPTPRLEFAYLPFSPTPASYPTHYDVKHKYTLCLRFAVKPTHASLKSHRQQPAFFFISDTQPSVYLICGTNNCGTLKAVESHKRANTRKSQMIGIMTPVYAYITTGFGLPEF